MARPGLNLKLFYTYVCVCTILQFCYLSTCAGFDPVRCCMFSLSLVGTINNDVFEYVVMMMILRIYVWIMIIMMLMTIIIHKGE